MSTKALKRLVDEALEHPNASRDSSTIAAAIAELEAIERAARVVSAPISSLSEFIEAMEVLERIAKEAK